MTFTRVMIMQKGLLLDRKEEKKEKRKKYYLQTPLILEGDRQIGTKEKRKTSFFLHQKLTVCIRFDEITNFCLLLIK